MHYLVKEFPCARLINHNKHIEWVGLPLLSAPKFVLKKNVSSDTHPSYNRQDVKLILEAFIVFHTKKIKTISVQEMKDRVANDDRFYHIRETFSKKNWNDILGEVLISLQDKEFIRIEDNMIYYN